MASGVGHRIALRLFGRLRLGRLLALLFAGIVVVTAAAVGTIHFRSSRFAIRGAVARMRRGAVARVAQQLDHYLSLPEQVNAGHLVLARQGLLPVGGDPDRLLRFFWEEGANLPGCGTIAFADANGGIFGANRPERYVVLADRADTAGAIRRYAPDPTGGRSGLILDERPGYDARQRAWYRAAVAAGKPAWSGISLSVTRPRLDLTAASPWIDAVGALRGVFFVDISLAQINEFLGGISRGGPGTVFIVERSGDLVASSTGEPPFNVIGGEPVRIERLRATASRNPVVAEAARVLRTVQSEEPGDRELVFRIDGQPYILAAARYSRGATIDWLIASATPESEFTGGIQAAARSSVLLTILAVVGAIGLGALTARWVVGPLLKLDTAAKAVADGHWEIPVPAGRGDEVGSLAASLAQMAERLRTTVCRLQSEIAERSRVEAALRESEERSRRMIETARDVVFVFDPDGTIVSLNPIFEVITGWTCAEWIGRPFHELLHQDDGARAVANLSLVLADQASGTREYRFRKRDGGFVIGEVLSFPLVEDGVVAGIIGYVRDVTARTRLEAQVRQAQKMEAVGHLAGGIAHDFNNILTAIIGYASLLQLGLSPGTPMRTEATLLLDAAEKAAGLTQGLLAFSRRQVVAPQPVDLNEVIAGVAEMLRRIIGEEIALRLDAAERTLVVVVDRGQLEQLIMNLVTNARDAMPGGGRITIATRAGGGDECPGGAGECAVVTVTDTGVGMDQRTQERMFEPFFTTKEAGKGTGLGLAVAYGIVTQHGGLISCASEPGAGTTFTLAFPLAAERTAPQPAPAPPQPETATPRERATILLVEDDPTVRAVTTSMLETGGFTVLSAPDGERGLEMFREHRARIDCVVTDLVMPGMDGKRLHDAVKALEPGAKVLFVSGYAADVLSERGLIGPGVHFLSKPLRLELLLRKIREVLAG